MEWIAISSSRRSSQPRDQTHVSWVFFTPEPPELWIGEEEWAAAAEQS